MGDVKNSTVWLPKPNTSDTPPTRSELLSTNAAPTGDQSINMIFLSTCGLSRVRTNSTRILISTVPSKRLKPTQTNGNGATVMTRVLDSQEIAILRRNSTGDGSPSLRTPFLMKLT